MSVTKIKKKTGKRLGALQWHTSHLGFDYVHTVTFPSVFGCNAFLKVSLDYVHTVTFLLPDVVFMRFRVNST